MSSCSNSECTCAEVIDSAERRQLLPGALDLTKSTEDLLWPRRNLAQDVKNFVAEKRDNKQSDRCEYWAEDFAAIKLRSAKRAKKAKNQQGPSDCEEQKFAHGKSRVIGYRAKNP